MTAAVGVARLFLRRLRFDPVAPLTMLVLVGVTCFLFAALPLLANDVADRGLRYTVGEAPQLARNVKIVEPDRIPPGDADPTAPVSERAAQSLETLPAALGDVVASSSFVVRSPRYILQEDVERTPSFQATTVGSTPGIFRYLTLRVQSGVDPHIKVVKGRLPHTTDERAETRVTRFVPTGDDMTATPISWTKQMPLIEVALSSGNARELRMDVGDRAVFVPGQSGDRAFDKIPIRDALPIAVKVVGIFSPDDREAPYWFGDPTLDEPFVQETQDLSTRQIFGQALVSERAYSSMVAATKPAAMSYEYRHVVDPERFDAGRLDSVSAAVNRVDARYAGAGPDERNVEVGLGPVLERYRHARSQAQTLLAIAALGLLACALANIGLLGALSYERRRVETGLSRSRGAASLQVLAAQAAEGLLIALPAGLAGFVVAVVAIEARATGLSAWLVAALVVATIVLLVGAVAGVARRPIRTIGREDVVLARPSPRRLALEAFVAGAAVLGVFLLRRRGLDASSDSGGFDPYLAAVPVLLGVACGIVALRLYPLPIRGAVRLARRARGVALHLGLSRAARQPDVGSAPLLVLVLALAIVGFSAAMLSTLDAGQGQTALRSVGAEVRVDAAGDGSLSKGLVDRLDDAGNVARAYVQDAHAGAAEDETPMIALELDAYQRLVAGTPAAVRFPEELRNPPIPGLVPAQVSSNWPAIGTFRVPLPRETLNALTVGNRDSFPAIPADTPFAIVPLDALHEAADEDVAPNRVYLSGVSDAEVRNIVREEGGGAQVASQAAVVRSLRASPLVNSVFRGLRAAIVLAALYAAVAVVLMALIAARSRARDLALVRTMGASQRDAFVLAAAELGPFLLVALALGIGLGIAIPHLVAPGLDLAFFTGTAANPIVVPWTAPVLSAFGLVCLVAAAVLVVGLRTRRAGLDRVLRIGER